MSRSKDRDNIFYTAGEVSSGRHLWGLLGGRERSSSNLLVSDLTGRWGFALVLVKGF